MPPALFSTWVPRHSKMNRLTPRNLTSSRLAFLSLLSSPNTSRALPFSSLLEWSSSMAIWWAFLKLNGEPTMWKASDKTVLCSVWWDGVWKTDPSQRPCSADLLKELLEVVDLHQVDGGFNEVQATSEMFPSNFINATPFLKSAKWFF